MSVAFGRKLNSGIRNTRPTSSDPHSLSSRATISSPLTPKSFQSTTCFTSGI